jgi:hypothetical protein
MTTRRPSTKLIRPLVLALTLAGVPAVAVSSASTSAAATCATTTAGWGSLTKSLNRLPSLPISNVRAGRHTCFDRMVVDLRGKGAGYTMRYVSQVRIVNSGELVPVRGGARLEIVIKALDRDSNCMLSYKPANYRELVNVTGFSTFRQIAFAGGTIANGVTSPCLGETKIGLGVRARLPMRVFILDGPGAGSRVVIDVAHRW